MKRILGLMLIFVLLAGGLVSCGGNDSPTGEAVTLKIGHIRPVDSVADKDVNLFKEAVESKSNGKLKVEVYPASQLGDYTVVQERVKIGDIEMQIAPVGTNLEKALGVSGAPYLVENWDQAKKVFRSDSVMVKEMETLLDKHDIKLLGVYPLYFGGIALVDEPVSPGDATVSKGIKIRVPPMRSFEKTAEALGYIATPLPWADTFTSMQTKIVNGAIGAGAEGYYSNFRDLVKYYLPLNDHFEMWFLYINKGVFEKLSKEQQSALLDAAKEMETKRFQEAEQQETEFEQLLTESGIEVIKFTDDELAAFAQKIRDEVWPVIREDYGGELFDKITNTLDQ